MNQVILEVMTPQGRFTALAVDGLIIHAQLPTATFAVRCDIWHNQACCICSQQLDVSILLTRMVLLPPVLLAAEKWWNDAFSASAFDSGGH